MSVPKTFLRFLTTDSMKPIVHHVLFFKFQILEKTTSSACFMLAVSMFYALLPTSIVGSMMLVEAITVMSVECPSHGEGFRR